MAYRYEQIPSLPSGSGNQNGVWHQLSLGPTPFGPPQELAALIDFASMPDFNIQ